MKENEEETILSFKPSCTNKIIKLATVLRDTDNDGIPDKDDLDDDNDGVSDIQEKLDNTNLKDKNDYKITKICYKVKD